MTKGPPESPPAADWGPSLLERYPPHGFPPYLGLGLLDESTLRLEPGRPVAEYRAGSDLVYRVTGSFDPAEGDTACGATASLWAIEEYFDGRPWRTTDGYESLPQAFYHHIGGQLPTENPRLAALIERLVCDLNLAVRIRAQPQTQNRPARRPGTDGKSRPSPASKRPIKALQTDHAPLPTGPKKRILPSNTPHTVAGFGRR